MGERERMDKASWKRGELPPLPLHTLCHPRLLHASLPPSCLALAFYSSSPPFFFFFPVRKGTTSSAVCSPFPPSPFTPFSLTPLLCPPFFSFFSSSSPLPPFKRMHYFQPRLCGVDREQNNGRLSVSRPSIGGGGGRTLAASIFFFSTVNSKQANAASLLLARLPAKLSRVKATLLQLFVCLHLCRPEKLWQEWEFLSQ